ncbi:STE STE11 BCK1 kinase, partial [Fusarium beomiforme]
MKGSDSLRRVNRPAANFDLLPAQAQAQAQAHVPAAQQQALRSQSQPQEPIIAPVTSTSPEITTSLLHSQPQSLSSARFRSFSRPSLQDLVPVDGTSTPNVHGQPPACALSTSSSSTGPPSFSYPPAHPTAGAATTHTHTTHTHPHTHTHTAPAAVNRPRPLGPSSSNIATAEQAHFLHPVSSASSLRPRAFTTSAAAVAVSPSPSHTPNSLLQQHTSSSSAVDSNSAHFVPRGGLPPAPSIMYPAGQRHVSGTDPTRPFQVPPPPPPPPMGAPNAGQMGSMMSLPPPPPLPRYPTAPGPSGVALPPPPGPPPASALGQQPPWHGAFGRMY